MKVGTLFGGCGGWDIGAWMAGAEPVWSVEIDPHIAKVQHDFFSRRAPMHEVVVNDVRAQIRRTLSPIDVLYASPVCKSHSKSTSRLDMSQRDHTWSGVAVPQWARAYEPQAIVIENVSGFRHHPSFLRIREELSELGYEERRGIFWFDRHGLPQSRERFLSWWTRGTNKIDQLLPTLPSVSWYDSSVDLLRGLARSKLAPWQIDRIKRMRSREVVGPYPWLVSSFNASTTRFKDGKTVIVGRFSNEPAWTVVASRKAQSALRVLDEDSTVWMHSLRMLARFQGFPEEWTIPADPSLAYTCIGNAVPPSISALVTQTLLRSL